MVPGGKILGFISDDDSSGFYRKLLFIRDIIRTIFRHDPLLTAK